MEAWEVTPAVFAAQIGHLVDTGYDVIRSRSTRSRAGGTRRQPAAAQARGDHVRRRVCELQLRAQVLTLVIRWTATMFVPTGYIGGTSSWNPTAPLSGMPVMSWEQLAEIRDAGIEIGAHAHVHRPLDEVAIRERTAREDVVRCKQILEDGLGIEVRGVRVPARLHGARVRAQVVAAGYGYACRGAEFG